MDVRLLTDVCIPNLPPTPVPPKTASLTTTGDLLASQASDRSAPRSRTDQSPALGPYSDPPRASTESPSRDFATTLSKQVAKKATQGDDANAKPLANPRSTESPITPGIPAASTQALNQAKPADTKGTPKTPTTPQAGEPAPKAQTANIPAISTAPDLQTALPKASSSQSGPSGANSNSLNTQSQLTQLNTTKDPVSSPNPQKQAPTISVLPTDALLEPPPGSPQPTKNTKANVSQTADGKTQDKASSSPAKLAEPQSNPVTAGKTPLSEPQHPQLHLTSSTAGNSEVPPVAAGQPKNQPPSVDNRQRLLLDSPNPGQTQPKSASHPQGQAAQQAAQSALQVLAEQTKTNTTTASSDSQSASDPNVQQLLQNPPSASSLGAAQTPKSTSPPSAASHFASLTDQLQQSIAASSPRPGQQLVVRLHPPELGSVLIKFQQSDDQLVGLLEVTKPQTRADIQQALPQIIRNLQELGVQIKRIEVALAPEHESSTASGDSPAGHRNGSPGQHQPSAEPYMDDRDWFSTSDWFAAAQTYRGSPDAHKISFAGGSLDMLV